MKKLVVLIALLFVANCAKADYVIMSNDLINSSAKMTQEQWTNKCAYERLQKYSSVWGCNNPANCPQLMYTLKRHCWNQYYLARQGAYFGR